MRRRPNSNMKEKAKTFVSAALKSAVGYSIYKAAYQLEEQAINRAKTKVKDATLYTIYISKNNISNGLLINMLRKETPKYHSIVDGKFEDVITGVGMVPRVAGMYIKFYNKTPIFINLNDAVPYGSSTYVPAPPLINPSDYSEDDGVHHRFSYRRALSGVHPQPTPSPVYTNGTAFIAVTTLNNKKMIHDMKCWLKKLIKESEQERCEMIESSKTLELTSNRDDITRSMKKRSMETVFIDENIKKDIMDSLDAFVCNREWYDDNFIPYHYGILLHGPAGTGKSTLIRAILTEYYKKYSKQGYTIENPSYLSSPSDLLHLDESGYGGTWAPRIIIIEDIDATVLKKRVPEEEEEKELEDPSNAYTTQQYRFHKQSMHYPDLTSLSEILNKMDGVANVENVIYIFTTNHIEQLDPALTRPGRIDKIVEIKMPRREDYDAFIFYHFKKHIPDDIVIRTSKLIAELQTDIVCKKTYEEMLEILQKED